MDRPVLNIAAVIFLGLLAVVPVVAGNRYKGDPDNVGLSIEQKAPAAFPPWLLMRGLHSGKVRLVISVNAEGRLVDQLVVAYTHEGFVKPVLEAVKEWSFEPAKVDGVPRSSRVDLHFEFKSDLNVTVNTADMNVMQDILLERYEYKPHSLKELDRIPTPSFVVNPVFPPRGLVPGSHRVVTVEFYIDEEGRVRIPAVPREAANDEFAAASVAAVEKWKFEPPMRHGQPVLVLARQEFRFEAKGK
jgi:TonB family protein